VALQTSVPNPYAVDDCGEIDIYEDYVVVLIIHQGGNRFRIFFDINLRKVTFEVHLRCFEQVFVVVDNQNFTKFLFHRVKKALTECIVFKQQCPSSGKAYTETRLPSKQRKTRVATCLVPYNAFGSEHSRSIVNEQNMSNREE